MKNIYEDMNKELDHKMGLVEYLVDGGEEAMKELLTLELGEDHPLIMAIVVDACDPDGGAILSELIEATIDSLMAEVKKHEVRIKYAQRGLNLNKYQPYVKDVDGLMGHRF